jgi:flavodoxin
MKSIILYYSRSGKTEKLAKKIAAALGSDILKVEVEKPYGNFFSTIIRAIREKSKGIIAAVSTQVPALDSYDTVLIGYPVWASDIPSFFSDFVQKCSLKGKRVIPFATNGGTNIESTMETLKKICPDGVVHPFNYGTSKKDNFDQWIEAVRG